MTQVVELLPAVELRTNQGVLVEFVTSEKHVGKDVYNPSVPFEFEGKRYIFGRIESRDSEQDSVVAPFVERSPNVWVQVEDAGELRLQDPCFTELNGQYVVSGIEKDWDSGIYRTVFYVGKTPFELEPLLIGPNWMKGIRLVELADGSLGAFTRPQGGTIFGLGKIGFTKFPVLSDLTQEALTNAPLILDHFCPLTWGGVNQARLLRSGNLGIIGHKARFTPEGGQYEAIAFELDPVTGECSEFQVIAQRADFPVAPSKRPDLIDVIYPAGIFLKDDKAMLIAGLSDTSVGITEIPWPFSSEFA